MEITETTVGSLHVNLTYSFGRFYLVDGKDCVETGWNQEKKHPNNSYPVEVRNCFESQK